MDFNTFLREQMGYQKGQIIPNEKIPVLKQRYNNFIQEQKQSSARIQAAASEFNVRINKAQQEGFTPDKNLVDSISSLLATGQVGEARTLFDNMMPKELTQSDIKIKEEMKQAEATAKKANQEKGRLLGKLNKFVSEEGEPTKALSDATGWGEGLATGIADYTGFPLNTPTTRSNQKQLSLVIEKDLLEATKYLKPVSNDEIQMLLDRRPAITDPPKIWSDYLSELRDIIKSDENVVEIAPSAKNPTVPSANNYFQSKRLE